MKIAYLISVHKDPAQLYRMIKALNGEDTHFFVHVDAKVNIADFNIPDDLTLPPPICKIKFTQNRYHVQWGGWNQVCYQKELLKECVMSGISFDRVFILTGQDYPLWSNERIKAELSGNPHRQYIKGLDITGIVEPKKIRKKIVLYHFFRDLNVPYRIKQLFSFSSRMIMTILPFRKKPYLIIDGKRWNVWQSSAYMCLTYDCVKFIYDQLSNNKRLSTYFRTAFAQDEMVIPTILFNSKYKEQATVINGGYCGLKNLSSITYFNYNKAIQVFTQKDYEELKESDMMFARKMQSGISDSLMDIIDKERNKI